MYDESDAAEQMVSLAERELAPLIERFGPEILSALCQRAMLDELAEDAEAS